MKVTSVNQPSCCTHGSQAALLCCLFNRAKNILPVLQLDTEHGLWREVDMASRYRITWQNWRLLYIFNCVFYISVCSRRSRYFLVFIQIELCFFCLVLYFCPLNAFCLPHCLLCACVFSLFFGFGMWDLNSPTRD